MSSEPDRPSIVGLLAPLIGSLPSEQQPALMALAERVAAGRYRYWAEAVDDADASQQLVTCAEREEEIARRVEGLVPDTRSLQDEFSARVPDIAEQYRRVFDGRTIPEQLAMQAEAERAGAAAWRAFAAGESEPAKADVLSSCALLEEESAATLDALIARLG